MKYIDRYIQLYFKDKVFSNLVTMQGHETNVEYTRTEKMILMALAEQKMNMGEISSMFEIPNSTANFMINKFKKKNLVTTEKNPEDRRIIEVSLSEQGREVLNEILMNLDERFTEMISKMIGLLEKKAQPEEVEAFKKCIDIILS